MLKQNANPRHCRLAPSSQACSRQIGFLVLVQVQGSVSQLRLRSPPGDITVREIRNSVGPVALCFVTPIGRGAWRPPHPTSNIQNEI